MNKERRKTIRIKNRYGLTMEQFNAMLVVQHNSCSICLSALKGKPEIDHDHETKQIRKLLCRRCNLVVGAIETTNPQLLVKMIEYLKEHKEEIGEELSDILYWVLLMSHDMDIDLIKAFERKMKINDKKYPVEKAKGKHTKYDKL